MRRATLHGVRSSCLQSAAGDRRGHAESVFEHTYACRWSPVDCLGERSSGGPGCPGAQPPQRRPRPPPRQAHRLHRPLRLREVVARLRHDLRRGPASLRRVAVRLRPAVPRPDGQARRRLHRGPVARGVDRPEVDQPQPAVDRRHHHRGLRLPAPAVRARRHAVLPGVRRAGHRPDAAADRRPAARAARGHPVPGPRAGRPRPQGRVRRPVQGAAGARASPARGSTARSCSSTDAARRWRRSSSTTSRSSSTAWCRARASAAA